MRKDGIVFRKLTEAGSDRIIDGSVESRRVEKEYSGETLCTRPFLASKEQGGRHGNCKEFS